MQIQQAQLQLQHAQHEHDAVLPAVDYALRDPLGPVSAKRDVAQKVELTTAEVAWRS